MSDAPALSQAELEILDGLADDFQPFALRHRAAVLDAGIPFRFISGRRPRSQQEALYDAYQAKYRAWVKGGRKGDPPRQAAKPGHSKHGIGFAYDYAGPRNAQEWQVSGELAERLNLESGHRYGDPGHVEMPDEMDALRALVRMRILVVALMVGIVLVVQDD